MYGYQVFDSRDVAVLNLWCSTALWSFTSRHCLMLIASVPILLVSSPDHCMAELCFGAGTNVNMLQVWSYLLS